jgi:hypothetical protein
MAPKRVIAFGEDALPDSFWSRVIPEPNSGCWLWTGRVDAKGYGRTEIRSTPYRGQLAHRHALSIATPLVEGLTIDHLCNTTCCVNPAHMRQVTAKENNEARGPRNTTCSRGHRTKPGECVECRRARQTKHRMAKKSWKTK